MGARHGIGDLAMADRQFGWLAAGFAAVALAVALAATPGAAQTAGAARAGTAKAGAVKTGVEAWERGDYQAAVAAWRTPAVAGDADAQFNLGQAYKLGRGVPTDMAQAEQWYRKAAEQGHAQAEDNYGLLLYQTGRKADAVQWLEKSAARDERRGELVLGTMLFNGDGVAKDWVRAYALVTRSSQQGLQQGSTALAQMDGYLSSEQRQQGQALAARIEADGKAAALRGAVGGTRVASATTAMPEPRPTRTPAPAATPAPRPTRSPATPPTAKPTPKPVPMPKPATPKPAATPAPKPPKPATPKPAATSGAWRVQLGAFGDPANARALWSRVAARLPGAAPEYLKAGAVTRLQAGPYPSRAAAQAACRGAGVTCVVVAR
jgi:uncharacterized protein